MTANPFKYIYGPVPSRRLGRSLGIDLVPFKTCTYDCIYCQLGRTTNKTMERRSYVPIEDIIGELKIKLATGEHPHYITIAGSGEPTLHSEIGELIVRIKAMTKIPVTVLTNGSLLFMPEVRAALMQADLVIPSLDAGDETMFRYVNRPHPEISFDRMVNGLIDFTRDFPGDVWLEVLLLFGITGMADETRKIAAYAERIGPQRVQLNTVCRPGGGRFCLRCGKKPDRKARPAVSGRGGCYQRRRIRSSLRRFSKRCKHFGNCQSAGETSLHAFRHLFGVGITPARCSQKTAKAC
jgi:wyosine [tRNA(Phe)-imidazoG37] synthetase (radical SAM superfamily)